jgi:phosphoribosyl 1,2-cyclic phosphodiesterase
VRIASLGSGSEGNSLIVEARADGRLVRLMIDCGFGLRDTVKRLGRLGLDVAQIDAILVTHEHADHVGSAFRVAREASAPVYLTYGTLASLPPSIADHGLARVIDSHTRFDCVGVGVEPFPVPHDAREPVQFVVDDGRSRVGVLTDIGMPTPLLPKALTGLSALVLECNHDPRMLAESTYPPRLKRRIGGDYGHLSNGDAARILASLERSAMGVVVAAHLSQQNNAAPLAQRALAEVMGWRAEEIGVAQQQEGLGWTAVA